VGSTQAALQKAAQALQQYGEAASSTSAVLAQLTGDLRTFLVSDSDEVPQSLRQLAKLARSREVQDSLRACVASAVAGATQPAPPSDGSPAEPPLADKLIEAFLSDRGHSLVGLAISAAARNSTAALCEQVRGVAVAPGSLPRLAPPPAPSSCPAAAAGQSSACLPVRWAHPRPALLSPMQVRLAIREHVQGSAAAPAPQQQPGGAADAPGAADAAAWSAQALSGLLDVLASERGERLLRLVISSSVSSMVRAYLEGASALDMYTPMLAAVSQPQHTQALSQLMSSAAGTATHELINSYFAASAAYQAQQQRAAAAAAAAHAGPGNGLGVRSSSCPRVEELSGSAAGASSSSAGGGDAECESDPGSPSSSGQGAPRTPEPSLIGVPVSTSGGGSWGGFLRRRKGGGGGGTAALPGLPGDGGRDAAQAPASSSRQLAVVGGGDLAAPPGIGSWSEVVSLMGQAARNDGIRRLMVDVSASSTREFVRAVMAPMVGAGAAATATLVPPAAAVQGLVQRIYVLLSIALFMLLFAVSPQLAAQVGSG
jgi:hypothetical protein